jgi:hypothetical protein
MQRLQLTSDDHTVTAIDPLAITLNSLMKEAEDTVKENQQKQLVALRKRMIDFMKGEVKKCSKMLTRVHIQEEKFLYDLTLPDSALQSIAGNEATDSEWDNLINFLKSHQNNLAKLTKQDKGFKLFQVFRHEFTMVFQENSPLRDGLDTVIEEINKNKVITAEDSEKLLENLNSLLYFRLNTGKENRFYLENREPLTIAELLKLTPALTILINTGLFTKANFLRFALRLHIEATAYNHRGHDNKILSRFYASYHYHLYMVPLIPYEFISRFITAMSNVNIVNQQNLEMLIIAFNTKTSTDPKAYAGWDPEKLLERFNNLSKTNKTDKYNDKFYDFLVTHIFSKAQIALSADEQTRVAKANKVELNATKENKIKGHLEEILGSLKSQLLLTESKGENEEKTSVTEPNTAVVLSTLIFQDNDEAAEEIIAKARDNIDAITHMQTILQDDGATKTENLCQLIVHADHVQEITDAYVRLKETEAFETPQAAFDALIRVAEDAQGVADTIQWLPLKDRTPENIETILREAFYSADFVKVTQYEEKHFRAKDADDRNITNEYLFSVNFLQKKEYLRSLVKIYEFTDKHKLSGGSIVGAMALRLPLAPAIADAIAEIPEEKFGQQILNEIISTCEHNELTLRREKIKLLNKVPKRISDTLSHYLYNFTVDFLKLVDGYLLLSQNRLLQKWEYVIKESDGCPIQLASTYAVELASSLIKLHEKKILIPENVELLLERRELSMAITEVLLKLDEYNALTAEKREAFKKQIHNAVHIAKRYRDMTPGQAKQLFLDTTTIMETTEWYDLGDDPSEHNDGTFIAISSKKPELKVKVDDYASDDEIVEEEIEIKPVVKATPPQPNPSATSTPPIPPRPNFTPEISAQELIKRCQADYNNSFFGRTKFLSKIATKEIDDKNMQQIMEYIKAHPHSRTARIYVKLYVEKLPDSDYKTFWNRYLQTYKFSFYQSSKLIDKLLAGIITNITDIKTHAGTNDSNRTAKLLRNYN